MKCAVFRFQESRILAGQRLARREKRVHHADETGYQMRLAMFYIAQHLLKNVKQIIIAQLPSQVRQRSLPAE